MNAIPSKSDSQSKRSGGLIVPHRPKWHGELAAFSVWMIERALARTWRLRFHDETGLFDGATKGPILFAIWHNRLASAMAAWDWVQVRHPGKGLAALVSASRDGGLLARTFEHFGVEPVRGSSSRRGAQALLELTSVLQEGYHVAITPDGPRGPKYRVQPGIISLAQVTGAPIVPFGARTAAKLQLRSWDGFQVPWPFARCELSFGKSILGPRDASEADRDKARSDLEAALVNLNPD